MTPPRVRAAVGPAHRPRRAARRPGRRARRAGCPAEVTAPSAIVIEVSTGDVGCARAPDQRRPIASTTKLMTALLTLERAKLDAVVPHLLATAPPPASPSSACCRASG